MTRSITVFIAFLATIIIIVACKHHPELVEDDPGGGFIPGPPDTVIIVNPDPCDPDTVYFYNTILPLLASHCAMDSCHDQVTHEDDVRLYDYAHIMQQVEPGDLNGSDLWEMITEDDEEDIMPPMEENNPLTQAEIDDIRDWILQGALANECTEDCNPESFSYAANIQPIVDQICSGCHAGASPSGDLALETYDQLYTIAIDGRLMHSLHGTNGYSLMPDNTTGLPECYISQFQNWVNAGAPQN